MFDLMTKKLLPLLILLAVYAVPLYPVFAETPPASNSAVRKLEGRKMTIQEEMQTKQERLASKSANLRERLQQFKDKAKVTVIERISSSLNTVNANATAAMLKQLDRLSNIVSKIETRLAQANENGKDTLAADQEVSNAKASIATTKAMIEAQQAKTYDLNVTTEQAAKAEVQTTRNQLFNDLKLSRDAVMTTKIAVEVALKEAIKVVETDKK